MTWVRRSLLPVLVVLTVLMLLWYAACVWLNADWAYDRAQRAGQTLSMTELLLDTWSQEKPRLPTPVQIGRELWDSTINKKISSKRSLIFHARITLSATLAGFALGALLGGLLAVGIVYSRVMDLSVMPWVITSQTIPILAIAPMVIVVLNSVGVRGLLPKAIISMYLSFFPVVVGMVKGLRAPDAMQLDQMRTWSASPWQQFWALRLPASMPYLFASLKVAIAAALVGAIVGELPTGAVAGLGARLLSGSYYGQTIQIWSALFMAAMLAAVLVLLVGLVERLVKARMGFR